MNKKSKKSMTFGGLVLIIFVVFDQFTKWLATVTIAKEGPFVLLKGVFELHYLENQSAAFGFDLISFLQSKLKLSYFTEYPDAFLTFKMAVFAILTIAVCMFLVIVFGRIPSGNRRFWPLNAILVFFVAGAIGNCIDRIFRGYVVDFFYFSLIDFPIFNVADIYVTASAAFLIVLGLFYYREDDFDVIFPSISSKNEDDINED